MVNPAVRFRFIKANKISSSRYRSGYFEREVINERELKFIQHWEKKRQLSKNKYIILHGVICISLPLLFIVKLIQLLIESGDFFLFYTSVEGLFFLFFELLFWVAGGIATGWLRHNFYETQYLLLTGKAEY
jgi:hypothetical protein